MIKSTSAMLERSKQRKLSTDADSTVPTSKALTTLTNEAGHQSGQIFGNTFFECHLTIKDNQVHFNSLMEFKTLAAMLIRIEQEQERFFDYHGNFKKKYSALKNAIAANVEK
ncbi:hypothetical protein T4A_13899 [Trichinella pseudospiralis]|uniref:Uncharacterized protein n=1 Tax=Trichinella pseudospiralis TaxID=6337 RepID=A0A0V1ES94_TRIPS|nr:hypothetical protein T4A_13899 [Trichinella pseudospiralis]